MICISTLSYPSEKVCYDVAASSHEYEVAFIGIFKCFFVCFLYRAECLSVKSM